MGVIRANYSALWNFAKVWNDALVSRNTDPKHVSPGILIAEAIYERDGVYYSFRGIPVRVADVMGNRSMVIEIIEDLSVRRPLERPNQTTLGRAEDTEYNIERSKNMETLTCPLPEITEACYPAGYSLGCFIWKLGEAYAVGSKGVPIVVSYVYGPFIPTASFCLELWHCGGDFHLIHSPFHRAMGSWVAVEPNAMGLPSTSSPAGLGASSPSPCRALKRYSLRCLSVSAPVDKLDNVLLRLYYQTTDVIKFCLQHSSLYR